VPDNAGVNLTVTELTDRLIASYARVGGINHLDGKNLPSKTAIGSISSDLLREETPMTLKWIAQRLNMGAPGSLANKLRTVKR
jgi:hypothetical protein